jgi:hypothetical protein
MILRIRCHRRPFDDLLRGFAAARSLTLYAKLTLWTATPFGSTCAESSAR